MDINFECFLRVEYTRTDATQSGGVAPISSYFFVLSLIETSAIPMHVA